MAKNTAEQITRSTEAVRSLARIVIYVTKAAKLGMPLDLDSISFWAHKIIYHAAMCHIKYGERDDEWADDLEVCKSYLKYFIPRYKLHSKHTSRTVGYILTDITR